MNNHTNGTLICVFFCSLTSISAKEKASTPNVLLIYADDLGRGMLSHYGQKYISTPNIDKLFKTGTAFEYAYGCHYSAPARASLLTGYHDCNQNLWNISRGGLFKNLNNYADLEKIERTLNAKSIELPQQDLLLAQVFKKAGYVTGQVGKLDWGFTATRQQMQSRGWDYYCGYLDHQRAHVFYPKFVFEADSILRIPENTHPTEGYGFEKDSPETYKKRWNMEGKVVYSQNLFLDKMIRFIHEHKDEPFFLYHPTQLPHGPVAIPEVHPSIKNNNELSETEKEYASMVKMLDEHVGILIAELEKLEILENTMIVFTTDNGHETYYTTKNRCRKNPISDMQGKAFNGWDYPYTSDLTGDLFNGNDGMSGKKWSNWEGGVRVPLVFTFPSKIAKGKVSKQVVANYDLLTTFSDLLNVKLTTKKDGVSLLPILMNNNEMLDEKHFVYVSAPEGPAVIDSEGWKLRFNKTHKKFRLHHLPSDYTESIILNEKYPERYNQLKKRLEDEVLNKKDIK